jgi:hypothetical protein
MGMDSGHVSTSSRIVASHASPQRALLWSEPHFVARGPRGIQMRFAPSASCDPPLRKTARLAEAGWLSDMSQWVEDKCRANRLLASPKRKDPR